MSDTNPANTTQRIDKWLWFARLVKTRSFAQRLVADGHVRINRTRLTKASQTVSAGDVISMLVHDRIRVVQVAGLGHRRGPAPGSTEQSLRWTFVIAKSRSNLPQDALIHRGIWQEYNSVSTSKRGLRDAGAPGLPPQPQVLVFKILVFDGTFRPVDCGRRRVSTPCIGWTDSQKLDKK